MDIGIWMSKELLAHKRESDVAVQVWNLPHLPNGLAENEPGRLFVAVDEHWRGFFRLAPGVVHTPEDRDRPCAVAFDPASWTPVLPEKAPRENQRAGYTLDVPVGDLLVEGKPRLRNEDGVGELISLLKKEERQE
jgi:hypothetical protein